MSHFVYILYSESVDTFYKGQTDDLSERIRRHNNGYEKSTSHGVPWRLVWKTEKSDKESALKLESKLKNLSRERLFKFIQKYSHDVQDQYVFTLFAGPDDPDKKVRVSGR